MWSVFRLEYEYTANPSNYRSVKEVPMMLNTEGYMDAAKDVSSHRRASVPASINPYIPTYMHRYACMDMDIDMHIFGGLYGRG